MPLLLTVASTVQCIHGGTAVLATENVEAQVYGLLILLVTDEYPVVGCPYVDSITTKPSPCVKLRWVQGTGTAVARGRRHATLGDSVPMVFMPTVGECLNTENIVQSVAILSNPSIADAL